MVVFHFKGGSRDMWGGQYIGQVYQFVVCFIWWLMVKNVQIRTSYPIVLQNFQKGHTVHNGRPCRIDKNRILFHFGDQVAIDQSNGLLGHRKVYGNNVTRLEDLIHGHLFVACFGWFNEWIVELYLARKV